MSKITRSKILTVILHVSAWMLLLIFPLWVLPRSPLFFQEAVPPEPQPFNHNNTPTGFELDPTLMQTESVVTSILLAGFFYLNMYALIPKVLSRSGWFYYLALVLGCLLLYLLSSYGLRLLIFPHQGHFGPPFFIGLPNFFMVFCISLALRLMQDRSQLETNLKEQETERLKSELSFLRSQVSPHFIFNVLNGVAALARKKSDQIEESIVQLSHLMRYFLYNVDKKVTIEKEAEYIRNYISLQKLRFGNSIEINFQEHITRSNMLIEPMLLIPFVENAFKHGIGIIKQPVILIILEVRDHELNFSVRNKFNPAQNETKDSSSGIGLQNTARRLQLLYKNMHSIDIRTEDNWFIAELKLILS